MSQILQNILKPLASLRLTVVLLALTMVLIFAGTWAQIDHDVWTVQKRYFHTFVTWIHFQLFLPRQAVPAESAWRPLVEFLRPHGFPMPGGYTLIGLLLMNLLAAHTLRFKYTIKRAGIVLIHGGIILLILGEVVTSRFAVEGQMPITEGQTVSYVEDIREAELAVIDPSSPDHDVVTGISAARLEKQDTIVHASLPFEIRVDRYMVNSFAFDPKTEPGHNVRPNSLATAGRGVGWAVLEKPGVSGAGAEASQVNAPSAYLTLSSGGRPLGTYLVSLFIDGPQDVDVGGRTYRLDLRWKRSYKPFSLTLLKFSHDVYTGTQTPRNFSSRLRLVDPTRGEDREVLIWMNHPLRYAGETFYQAAYRGPTTTVLQVVRNPGWLIPYISCVLVGAGMLVHFGVMLLKFLSRVRGGAAAPTGTPAGALPRQGRRPGSTPQQYVLKPRPGMMMPALITGLCFLYLLSAGRPPKLETAFDLNTFARVPISYEGRVMPLDTLARVSLRVISGKSELRTGDGKRPAIQWLADVLANPRAAEQYKSFRIDHPDLKNLLALDASEKMFTIDQIMARVDQLNQQYQLSGRVPAKDRDPYQKAVIELGRHVQLFNRLAGIETLYIAPPTTDDEEWKTYGEAVREAQAGPVNPGLRAFGEMLRSYHFNEPASFNAAAGGYLAYLGTALPSVARKSSFEVMFNNFEPFVKSISMYVLVFLLVCAAWLIAPARATLMRMAFWVLMLTLSFHTLGLIGRIYIQGRPPVTNLYSSAIFIGWAAVLLCILIEWIYKNGIGSLAASVIAVPSLIIAHFLAGSGDTMQMLQAVLDTNLWLATHVIVITMGYSAAFLAGILGCVYVIGGIFTRSLHEDGRKALARMTYGSVCFAMLLSFVGTVLGGIWADQSWGRFWGWDPKENGAALIVLWLAIILHARWAGIIRERGLAILSIFAGVVTAWSWFGTNMMGVGLHSYGFMDSAVFWLVLFMLSQVFLMALGNLPLRMWRSIDST
jgi:ABC-type transport system involved in cytochrome c biogenesis permease subunit